MCYHKTFNHLSKILPKGTKALNMAPTVATSIFCLESNFWLKHDNPSDFYLMSCQTSKNPVPLLVIRCILLIMALFIIFYDMAVYMRKGLYNFWFIYLTHWGLLLVTWTTVFSLIVSIVAVIKWTRRNDYYSDEDDETDDYSLPWYVQIYWALYNCAYPLSILITIFFWGFLFKAERDNVFEVFLGHGCNTVLMVLHLVTSRQPSRFHHFYFSCVFSFIWCIFSIIYYLCGGVNMRGYRYIYPMVAWWKPVVTTLVMMGVASGLIIIHCIAVGLVMLRNLIAEKLN